ncbi:MAG: undecaprenyl-diphosphate phosphatase [Aquificaceae bacterium]|nr:undecaprenyl-diphosphate phosphatase [Aquificaceae bacterium]MCX8060174.1 undecaprenyl-diphosphate phosphatase [Aquificaceae bacterium]MDW8096990.1 undecaprenyl-diphosphate phosphatase [Aquificaceae bacterium]
MEVRHALIMGAIEGLTEFLPVSSTGHLILTAHVLGLPHDQFTKSFEIAIQLGAILAVVFLYWRRLAVDLELWKRIGVAFLPTGLLGFSLYRLIKDYLIGNDVLVVFTLVLGGVFLLFADRVCERFCHIGDIRELSYGRALVIGLFQSLAIVPGVSRSGATIVGGMLMGLNRRTSAEFSFLLAVPTMLVATGYDLLRSHEEFSLAQWQVLGVGFVSAFLFAMLSVKALLSFLARHSFLPFGVYRIAVGLLYAYFFLL